MEHAQNRLATLAETEYAAIFIETLEFLEVEAAVSGERAIDEVQAFFEKETSEPGELHPVIVRDFKAIKNEKILLIPPGTHIVPKYFFKNRDCVVIGLTSESGEKPTLRFDHCTGKGDYDDPETGETIEVFAAKIHDDCRFIYLKLEAENKTVLECGEKMAESLCESSYRRSGFISFMTPDNRYFYSKTRVDLGENIEIYDVENENFKHEYPWAIEACKE